MRRIEAINRATITAVTSPSYAMFLCCFYRYRIVSVSINGSCVDEKEAQVRQVIPAAGNSPGQGESDFVPL